MTIRMPSALTVAGSDSGGGAGIQADLATFLALGVHGTTAVTAVTAQNARGITRIHAVPPDVVAEQIRKACAGVRPGAAKTGMLSEEATVRAVASALTAARVTHLVVDPVLASTSGTTLLSVEGLAALREDLLPLATVVTPNLAEAAMLAGRDSRDVGDVAGMREAARVLHDLGPAWVLVKGGHLPGPPIDLLFDGSTFVELEGERIEGPPTHGTGCVLSAAIAAHLARGLAVPEAVVLGKAHVAGAIRYARDLGDGGSVNPAWSLLERP
jgi:hydroxymethylpyrimidine/phosphomethylpyrimidine kinase